MIKSAYSPHRINKNQLRPLNDNVLVSDMVFEERFTSGGIVLPSDNGKSGGVRPRWGQVYSIGTKQVDVQVGQWVCVAHGRWTRGLDIENESGKITLRKVDPKDILLVSDTLPDDDTMSDAI